MVNYVCHVEIPILDKKEATAFYKAVFGWNLDFESIPNYALVGSLGNEVSIGFEIVDELPKTNSLVYIEVEDIEATLKDVVEAGGEVVSGKRQITPEIGYSASFKDSAGSNVGLHSRT